MQDNYLKEIYESRQAARQLAQARDESKGRGTESYEERPGGEAGVMRLTRRVLPMKKQTNNNKDNIMHIQSRLRDKGYDLGDYGPDKDGVDGVVGPKTLTALRQYFDDNDE